MFDALLHIDRLYVGGGNAKKLTVDLGHRVELVDNAAGILGGIKLWELGRDLETPTRELDRRRPSRADEGVTDVPLDTQVRVKGSSTA